jgi:acetate kinase
MTDIGEIIVVSFLSGIAIGVDGRYRSRSGVRAGFPKMGIHATSFRYGKYEIVWVIRKVEERVRMWEFHIGNSRGGVIAQIGWSFAL